MRKIIYSTLAVFALVSCTKKEEVPTVPSNYPVDGVVRISAEVNTLNALAEESAKPFTGENLSMTVYYGNKNNSNQFNIKWTSADAGITWTSTTQMTWKNATTAAKIYAFAPYLEGENDPEDVKFPVPTDQTGGLESADFLGYTNTSFIPENSLDANQSIKIELKHLLSKLTLNIIFGDDYDTTLPTSITEATIYGFDKVIYNFFKGELKPYNYSIFKMHKASERSLDVIMPPQTISKNIAGIIKFKIGQTSYSFTTTKDITLIGGTSSVITLRIGKDKATVSSVEVSDWNTGEPIADGDTD